MDKVKIILTAQEQAALAEAKNFLASGEVSCVAILSGEIIYKDKGRGVSCLLKLREKLQSEGGDSDQETPKNEQNVTPIAGGTKPEFPKFEGGKTASKRLIIADKLVGKAAAMLGALMGAEYIHGVIMSEAGCEFLQSRQIAHSYDTLTPRITNLAGDDYCPIEKSVLAIRTPEEALPAITATIRELMKKKQKLSQPLEDKQISVCKTTTPAQVCKTTTPAQVCKTTTPAQVCKITIPAQRLCEVMVIDTSMDVEITNCIGHQQKLSRLTEFYDKSTEVTAMFSDGSRTLCLGELLGFATDFLKSESADQEEVDSVFIAGVQGFNKERYGFADLVRIISRLTAEDGCEWDKVQTHQSIASNLIEEAYEAAWAALTDNIPEMREEYGDCLLQPVLNCDIAARAGEFTLGDCITELCKKLYSRHTHIFGDNHAASASEALGFWEQAKAKEKNYTTALERIAKLPDNLPTLMRTQKVIKAINKEINKELKGQENSPNSTSETPDLTLANQLLAQINKSTLPQAGEGEQKNLLLKVLALYTLQGVDAETELIKATAELINNPTLLKCL